MALYHPTIELHHSIIAILHSITRHITRLLQKCLAHKKVPAPQDRNMTRGIVLLYIPKKGVFLMSEHVKVGPDRVRVRRVQKPANTSYEFKTSPEF